MSTTKNIDERINEVAENHTASFDFPAGRPLVAQAVGIPTDVLTEDLYEQYCAAFWEVVRRG